jgi:hypothetical protein
VFNDAFPIGLTDPVLFTDDDGRVYLYYGCSNENGVTRGTNFVEVE